MADVSDQPSPTDQSPLQLLAKGALAGQPLDEFGPVWNTAFLRFARSSWQHSGLEPFLRYEVPHTATSSGRLSEDALDMVLSAIAERAEPEGGFRFLEIGSGSGLFAKLFLDRLRELAPNIYANSNYFVTDGAQTVLDSQCAYGVLDAHEANITRILLDANQPLPDELNGKIDFVFATYVLDSLAFDILAVNDAQRWRLQTRTVYTGSDAERAAELQEFAKKNSLNDWDSLARVGAELSIQTRYVDLKANELTCPNALPSDTGGETYPMLHSYGAIRCIENCIAALRSGGAMLFSDYGSLAQIDPSEEVEFQFFGDTIAHGLNFHQFDSYYSTRKDIQYFAPNNDGGSIHTRMIATSKCPDLSEKFEFVYGEIRQLALNLPIETARELLPARLYEKARKLYGKALRYQPRNWSLLEEIATFVLLPMKDAEGALAMVEQGLEINPYGSGLWRTKADSLVLLKQFDEASRSYEHALKLNPKDAQTYLSLAQLRSIQGDQAGVLRAIANAFINDQTGDLQESIRAEQDKALVSIAEKERDRLIHEVNRFRHLDDLPSG